MAYQLYRSGLHVVIRWEATPTPSAIERLHLDIDAAYKATGAPLVCFVVIPTDDVDLPGAEARRVFQARLKELHERSTSLDVVLIGDSLRASLVRTTLRAMSMVTRTGDRVRIHNGPDEALKGRNVPASVVAALRGTATV